MTDHILKKLLFLAIKNNASDLHLSSGCTPSIRIDGELHSLDPPIIGHNELNTMIHSIMNDQQRHHYAKHLETDFSFAFENTRCRVNAYTQNKGCAAAFRILSDTLLTLEQLQLPTIVKHLACFSQGLIVVTGATGSGKSTTVAAIIDHINNLYRKHIITIEDPIEYLHTSNNCLINQRELYRDTLSFHAALRSALRQDPDIILIGELRDLETIRLAMTAAETGHLVLATLHSSSAAKTINRIIDGFPSNEQSLIRSLLSHSLQAVISQQLVKRKEGGRVAAFEVMICNTAIRHLIREDKIAQMYSTIQMSKALGMQTLDQHLSYLVNDNIISLQTAQEVAVNPQSLLTC